MKQEFRDPPNHAPMIVSQKMRALYFEANGKDGTDHEVHQWYWESCIEPKYSYFSKHDDKEAEFNHDLIL